MCWLRRARDAVAAEADEAVGWGGFREGPAARSMAHQSILVSWSAAEAESKASRGRRGDWRREKVLLSVRFCCFQQWGSSAKTGRNAQTTVHHRDRDSTNARTTHRRHAFVDLSGIVSKSSIGSHSPFQIVTLGSFDVSLPMKERMPSIHEAAVEIGNHPARQLLTRCFAIDACNFLMKRSICYLEKLRH